MRSIFLTLISIIILAGFYSCTSSSESKIDTAIDSTTAFILRWEKRSRESMLTEEERKTFTDQCNELVLRNKAQGVVRENMSKEKVRELELLYGRARAIKTKMILNEMQDNMLRRGTNSARGEANSGELITDF
ncbi:MAG: hypothetical protein EOO89_07555 [Pedobacter sp.]|nr:MAG: hypothetical protein EOO89_07555 [Pedobacter sp.]